MGHRRQGEDCLKKERTIDYVDVAEMSATVKTEKCPLHLAIKLINDLSESNSDEVIRGS